MTIIYIAAVKICKREMIERFLHGFRGGLSPSPPPPHINNDSERVSGKKRKPKRSATTWHGAHERRAQEKWTFNRGSVDLWRRRRQRERGVRRFGWFLCPSTFLHDTSHIRASYNRRTRTHTHAHSIFTLYKLFKLCEECQIEKNCFLDTCSPPTWSVRPASNGEYSGLGDMLLRGCMWIMNYCYSFWLFRNFEVTLCNCVAFVMSSWSFYVCRRAPAPTPFALR